MIRTKPSTDVYRDGWDRVFGDKPKPSASFAELLASEIAGMEQQCVEHDERMAKAARGEPFWRTDREDDEP